MSTSSYVPMDTVLATGKKLRHLTVNQVIFLINKVKETYDTDDHEASQYLISNRKTYFLFSNGHISPPRTNLN